MPSLKASEKEDHRQAGEIILGPGMMTFYVHHKEVCVCAHEYVCVFHMSTSV